MQAYGCRGNQYRSALLEAMHRGDGLVIDADFLQCTRAARQRASKGKWNGSINAISSNQLFKKLVRAQHVIHLITLMRPGVP